MANVSRKFPHHHRFGFNLSPERRKYNGAMNGIKSSVHTIGYYTEEIAERIARGPLDEDKELEDDRLDDLKIFNNTIASHHRKMAEHHEMLASIPAMMD